MLDLTRTETPELRAMLDVEIADFEHCNEIIEKCLAMIIEKRQNISEIFNELRARG